MRRKLKNTLFYVDNLQNYGYICGNILLINSEVIVLKEAYDLLEQKYSHCCDLVKNDEFFTLYADEKKRHSLQVMGAGNYIIRRVQWLKNKPESYIEMVKTAVFLHDVCRFEEIEYLFAGKKNYDHGVEAGNLLQTIPLFNDIRIWLPIKHHGHLIEELYADEVYQNIRDKELQKQVELICFIIRDADKIANMHMMVNEKNILPLFLGKTDETYCPQTDGVVSDIINEEAFAGIKVSRDFRARVADRCISYLSWFTDINYQASVCFCNKLNVIPKLITLFENHCCDEDFKKQYLEYFNNYLKERVYLH